MNRKYYYLKELSKVFGLSDEDINYLTDEHRLKLSVKHQGLLVLGDYRDGKFCGYCSCAFDGLMTLHNYKSRLILKNGKHPISEFVIEKNSEISNVKLDYAWSVTTPIEL